MWLEIYTREKLRALERESRSLRARSSAGKQERPLAPLVRAAGKLLSRLGGGLEGWGEPRPARPECCEACG